MIRLIGRETKAASAMALLAVLALGLSLSNARAEDAKAEDKSGFSIFGVNISVSNPVEDDEDQRPKAPAGKAAPEAEKPGEKGRLSIFGVDLGVSDDDEAGQKKKAEAPVKKPEAPKVEAKKLDAQKAEAEKAVTRRARALDESAEDDGGFSIFGVSIGGSDKTAKKAKAAIKDPSNTVIMTIGLGYDSARDKTPAKTAEVVIELFPKVAPKHVERIKALTRKGYYNGKLWHRVVEGFMAQTGSPDGTGVGGARGFSDLKAEFSKLKFKRAVVGMARTADLNSANAQFFIMFERDFMLDQRYTVIGRVLSGMEGVDQLQRTARYTAKGEEPIPEAVPDRIIRVKLASAAQR